MNHVERHLLVCNCCTKQLMQQAAPKKLQHQAECLENSQIVSGLNVSLDDTWPLTLLLFRSHDALLTEAPAVTHNGVENSFRFCQCLFHLITWLAVTTSASRFYAGHKPIASQSLTISFCIFLCAFNDTRHAILMSLLYSQSNTHQHIIKNTSSRTEWLDHLHTMQ